MTDTTTITHEQDAFVIAFIDKHLDNKLEANRPCSCYTDGFLDATLPDDWHDFPEDEHDTAVFYEACDRLDDAWFDRIYSHTVDDAFDAWFELHPEEGGINTDEAFNDAFNDAEEKQSQLDAA
jgi:hypothetical protein